MLVKINIFSNNQKFLFETKIDLREWKEIWNWQKCALYILNMSLPGYRNTVNGIHIVGCISHLDCFNWVTEDVRERWHWLKVKFPALILCNFLCFNGPMIQPNLYNHTLKFPVGIETITKSAKDMSQLCWSPLNMYNG